MATKNPKLEESPFGQSAEAVVVMSGRHAVDFDVLVNALSDEQYKELVSIVNNPNHPWMIEHEERTRTLMPRAGEGNGFSNSDILWLGLQILATLIIAVFLAWLIVA